MRVGDCRRREWVWVEFGSELDRACLPAGATPIEVITLQLLFMQRTEAI